MALTQIFPPTEIDGRVGPAVRRWPAGAEKIKFVLDDSQFTDPALSVTILMQCSWNNKQSWPFTDGPNTWQGGAKMRDGSSPSVTLGPFIKDGVAQNPTHVRFFAEPGPGSGPVTVGLLAEVSPDS